MIKSRIEPFVWIDMENGQWVVSLDAGNYRELFFQGHSEQFESDNGNGYDWEFLAEMFLESCFPEMIGSIQFDSEADEFCMYSDQKNALEVFALEFKKITDDLEIMEEVWNNIGAMRKVYVAMEYTPFQKPVLSYVGVTTLPLEDRLIQHQLVDRNFAKLLLVEEFPDSYMARGYEEVIEEIMTNPALNKGHLFINQNNSIHPCSKKDEYENATTVAIEGMRLKGHISSNGNLDVMDRLVKEQDGKIIYSDRKVTEKKEYQIGPFVMMKLANGMFSVCLDTMTYKKGIFSLRNDDGIMGSGYDWNKVAGTLLRKLGICKTEYIYFLSEADLFCAYSKHPELLKEFVNKMYEMCEDDMQLKRVIMSI